MALFGIDVTECFHGPVLIFSSNNHVGIDLPCTSGGWFLRVVQFLGQNDDEAIKARLMAVEA